MTLEIISGGAGTGKTRRCTELLLGAVAEGRAREVLFLLFNNHQVRATREYLQGNLDAYIEPSLLTFHGLINEILFRSLSPPPRIAPENVAWHLFRKAVEESDLSYYRAAARSGLVKLLKNVVDELKANGIPPDAFQDAARQVQSQERFDATFANKAREVSHIYRRYQQLLQEYGYEEWPDAAYRAVQLLKDDPGLLAGKKLLLVDGFFYLTPWQKSLLSALLERVPRSIVTICYSGERPELFRGLEDMYRFLISFPKHEVQRLTENRRTDAASLRHVEEHLFRPAPPAVHADDTLCIYEASGQDAEAEFIARSVKRMVMEEGYHYADFGVLLRSDANYKDVFRQVFNRFDVPIVTSRSLPLKEIPCIRAVISLLRVVTKGWHRENVIAFLRDAGPARNRLGTSAYPAHVVDFMENRALAHGIDDKQGWLREFGQGSQTENEGDAREGSGSASAFQELLCFEERLRSPRTVRHLVGALTEIVRELGMLENAHADGVGGSLPGGLARPDLGWPDVRIEAAATVKLYDLLSQFLDLAGKEDTKTIGATELLEFIADAAETLTVELPAETRSGVWVSNVFEARAPELKVVFVAGLSEGWFPPRFSEDPIFRDRERRFLNRTGKVFLQEKMADADREKYLFYIALTRASDKVVLTSPNLDSSGKEKLVSFYMDEFRKLFTHESLVRRTFREDYSQILPPPGEIINQEELVKRVVRGLREERVQGECGPGAEIASLYNLALDRGHETIKEILTAGNEEDGLSLSQGKVRVLLQVERPYSLSEIHTYGSCKFKYYCRYLLGLLPKKEHQADLIMEGDIYHEALRRLYLKSTWEETNAHPADCEAFVQSGLRELDAVMEEKLARHLASTRGENLKARMKVVFQSFLENEFEYQKRGPTHPAYLELGFGAEDTDRKYDSHSSTEPLRLKSTKGDETRLQGRMDRVDLIDIGGKTLGIVLDYKRGRGIVNLNRMLSGEDIRLLLYMLALERLFGIEPGGGLYYSINQSSKRGLYLSEFKHNLGGGGWGLSHRDAFTHEQIAKALSEAEKTALERVEHMRNGEITAKPLKAEECRYCDYSSVCRYERAVKRSRPMEED